MGLAPDSGIELFWICSSCEHRWHYYSPDDREYPRAQSFITNPSYPLARADRS